ncbi:MAG: hypothetical protein LBK40_08235 [Spirochaetaceae bacterium]|jgi:hypothetical protein|nr:hypothetical protein [Spirochaetaceae bacterium]
MAVPRPEQYGKSRIENLRELMDNKEYLDQAIHRIAQILSNEIVHSAAGADFAGNPAGGEGYNE